MSLSRRYTFKNERSPIEKFLDFDSVDPSDFNEEIAIIRSLIQKQLDEDEPNASELLKTIETLSRVILSNQRVIQYRDMMVDWQTMTAIARSLVSVVNKHVRDVPTRRQIAQEMQEVMRGAEYNAKLHLVEQGDYN